MKGQFVAKSFEHILPIAMMCILGFVALVAIIGDPF